MRKIVCLITLAASLVAAGSASANHYLGAHWFRWEGTTIYPTVVAFLSNRWTNQAQIASTSWGMDWVKLGYWRASDAQLWPCAHGQRGAGQIDVCQFDGYPSNQYLGLTIWTNDANGHFLDNYGGYPPELRSANVGIIINNNHPAWIKPDGQIAVGLMQKVLCHEVGHALGMNDRYDSGSLGSCMMTNSATANASYPDGHDHYESNTVVYGRGDRGHYPGPPLPAGQFSAEYAYVNLGPRPTPDALQQALDLRAHRIRFRDLGLPPGFDADHILLSQYSLT
jgi:hypothetical protein